jgi:suppressor for copper-sensitivity B
MRKSRVFARVLATAVVATLVAGFSVAVAQAAGPPFGGKVQLNDLLGKTRTLPGLQDETKEDQPIVHAALTPTSAKAGSIVTLSVTVSLPADSHTYSMSPEVPGATRIELSDAAGLESKGDFEADRAPSLVKDPVTGKNVEQFERVITWLKPYVVTADKPEAVRVAGTVDLRYCDSKSCRTFSQPIRARLVSAADADEAPPPDTEGGDAFTKEVTPATFGGQAAPARLKFVLSPRTPKAGDLVTLAASMHLESGWHTYSTTQKDSPGSTTTKFKLAKGNGLQPIGESFQPDRAPELTAKGSDGLEPKEVYHGDVTWIRRFKYVPKAGEAGIGIEGNVHFGICNEATCLPPKTVSFSLGNLKGATELPKPLPDDGVRVSAAKEASEGSIWFYLGAAFIGGLILNVMPCVLPVLAIKILSFVQQAGESRSRIFVLNVSYTAGVLAVFLSLATLAVGTQLGLSFVGDFSWGGLFQHTRFNLVMACVVFGMGLSLLGVFEIPVPGMVGSAAGQNQGEGLLGAFLTGIFATLLATPCTGPVMASALGWSVRQPPLVVYLVWGVMGLGMASPYLVLGLFPRFIKWLPKPGMWMIRFKEFAGFLLLGSVIFIIYYTDKRFTIPLLVMLLGIAIGLWMIGNLYDLNSHIRHKMVVRVVAILLAGGICWGGYGLAGENKYNLDWQPFSESRLAALMKENKTVLVDFTADWCINCHFNEYIALNTRETQELVKKHGVATLKADFTEESPEIRRWLLKFKQDGVPLTVIFPAGRDSEPIVLESLYTQGTLLESLKKAVSKNASSAQVPEHSTAIR